MNPHLDDLARAYLDHLVAADRASTASAAELALRAYVPFLTARQRTPATACDHDAHAFRAFLATPAASDRGIILAASTQGTRIAYVRAFHRWLRRRGHAITDPTRTLPPQPPRPRTIKKDILSQQEAQAFLATAAAEIGRHAADTRLWAIAVRDLAMVSLAIATARRCEGLCNLRVDDLDAGRGELRVESEKALAGRVLPVAPWGVAIAVAYRDRARPVLLRGRATDWLFVGTRCDRVGDSTYQVLVRRLAAATCAANPDLADLPGKRISSHSLRAACARLLFVNGCPIASVSKVLLHRKLSTTSAYVPLTTEDLRRMLVEAEARG